MHQNTKTLASLLRGLPALLLSPVCLLTLSCIESRTREAHSPVNLQEASGICVVGDQLLIVGDDSHGQYFIYDLSSDTPPVIPLDPERLREVKLPGAALAMDLEAIDILADGRIAVLSEQLRCLVSTSRRGDETYKAIAEYDKSVSELGNRGLEGLAVKAAADGASLVAVLWEGGYPIYRYLPAPLRETVGQVALEPVVIIHQIEQNSETGWVGKPFFKFELNTPKDSASTPGGQRFRAPDLVWHAWETDTGAVQGLIVLLQSEDAPLPASGLKPEYKRKILLRYDLLGQPHGDAVEINELVQEVVNSLTPQDIARFSPAMGEHLQQVLSLLEEGNWENVNWEGLAWYDPGRSLIVVYDTVPLEPPIAFVVPLPEGW